MTKAHDPSPLFRVDACIDAAANVCGVPRHLVVLSFSYSPEDAHEDDDPGMLVIHIKVHSNVMMGRGRNRKRAAVYGTGLTIATAIDDLTASLRARENDPQRVREKKNAG